MSNGLTITNSTGLQNYVWIEVPTTISATVSRNGTDATVSLANAQDNNEILEILGVYVGKGTEQDYTKGASSQNYEWKDEWYDSKGKTVATSTNQEDTAGCGLTYNQYQTAYNNMLESIKEYGGFWLAQYEAGIAYEEEGAENTTNRKTHSSITILKANYARNQYPYNYVSIVEAQTIANTDSTNKYTSSLPFGIQWDLVCEFLEVNKAKTYEEIAVSSTWGNYSNTNWTSNDKSKNNYAGTATTFKGGTFKKTTGGYLLTTGAIESTTSSLDASPMNIYDLAGNVYEFTLEHSIEEASKPGAYRGGYFNGSSNSYPLAHRASVSTTFGSYSYGFRSTLY